MSFLWTWLKVRQKQATNDDFKSVSVTQTTWSSKRFFRTLYFQVLYQFSFLLSPYLKKPPNTCSKVCLGALTSVVSYIFAFPFSRFSLWQILCHLATAQLDGGPLGGSEQPLLTRLPVLGRKLPLPIGKVPFCFTQKYHLLTQRNCHSAVPSQRESFFLTPHGFIGLEKLKTLKKIGCD